MKQWLAYRGLIVGGLSAVMSLVMPTARGADTANKPNIVLIVADDLGIGDISCYGSKTPTPHLDNLATNGKRFTDFHVSAPVCSPSRAGFITGRYQQYSGIDEVLSFNPDPAYGLMPNNTTIAEVLKRGGYATGMAGKWHMGHLPPNQPVQHGFDEFWGYLGGALDYYEHVERGARKTTGPGRPDWYHNADLVTEDGYATDLITRHACDYIAANKDKPFFLYVAEHAVHGPYQNPPAMGGPKSEKAKPTPAERAATYAGMTRSLDDSVGQVMDALKRAGLEQNTLVFFFSDNGALAVGSNKPYRGFKHELWEGGQREPAIAYWPGHIKPGVSGQFLTALDLMPTFSKVTRSALPDAVKPDGVDISDVLLQDKTLGDRKFFWSYRDQLAMRDGPWKVIKFDNKFQLYDLSKDPGESNDLAAKEPARFDAMKTAVTDWFTEIEKHDPSPALKDKPQGDSAKAKAMLDAIP